MGTISYLGSAICDIKSSIISLIKFNLKISMALDGILDNSVLSNINYWTFGRMDIG